MNHHDTDKATLLEKKLIQSLVPTTLEIIDEGEQHRGHAEEGAGHFKVRIASPLFQNKSLIECHRLVYKALGTTVGTDIHALRIEVLEN
jgi:BolA family transcriptional regulator, general stress-responsive regulator